MTLKTMNQPFPSPLMLPNPSVSPMVPKSYYLLLVFFSNLSKFICPQPQPGLFVTNVFTMVIIRRIVQNTVVPIVTSQPLVTQLTIVCLFNAISAIIGGMEPNSVPIGTVWFVLNQGTSWVIAYLNIFPLLSHLPLMEVCLLPSFSHQTLRSLVIKPGA